MEFISLPRITISGSITDSIGSINGINYLNTANFNKNGGYFDKEGYFRINNDKIGEQNIHKGDFTFYDTHITFVYSNKLICDEDNENCVYEIIHAYGGSDDKGMYKYPDIPEAGENRGKKVFGRKTIKTFDIPNDRAFGRIYLWN